MPALHHLFDFDSLDDIDPTATDDKAPAPLTGFDAEIVEASEHAHGHQVSNDPSEIPLDDAIEALHREAKKIEAIG